MIVLVTGGRDYNDGTYIYLALDALHSMRPFDILVHGCASGLDRLAATWAISRGIHPAGVPALWDTYGKPAGGIRNSIMLLLRPKLVVAFPGGRGTANMVRQAQSAGIRVIQLGAAIDINADLINADLIGVPA
jgi:hypothetical protein